jgi:hypothetical protein
MRHTQLADSPKAEKTPCLYSSLLLAPEKYFTRFYAVDFGYPAGNPIQVIPPALQFVMSLIFFPGPGEYRLYKL